MPKRVVTIETRLQNNTDLTNYLNNSVTVYERTKRQIWQIMTNKQYKKRFHKESEFTKWCRQHFNLHSRTINSIIHEVKGLMNSYMELKQLELNTINEKINTVQEQITKDKKFINKWKPLVTDNNITEKELTKYTKRKETLYQRQCRLNKLIQRKLNLEYIIEHEVFKVCFGSKKCFKRQYNLKENNYKTHIKWYNEFIKQRDKNIYFVGASNETLGNQMISLNYVPQTNTFTLTLRRIEKTNNKRGSEDNYIVYENLKIPYKKEILLEILNNFNLKNPNVCPLTYRFHRKGNKWYLQITFTRYFNVTTYKTRCNNGVIGLDYNVGFIQLAETDRSGNLINLIRYNLKYHGCGNEAKTEIEQTISAILNYALNKGKDIAIENLDFKKTKSKQNKGNTNRTKNYNRMTHTFDYSRYKQTLINSAFNKNVLVYLINPKNTSKIGEQKYSYRMKLTTHQAAAYVIARRYQGFNDRLIKTT